MADVEEATGEACGAAMAGTRSQESRNVGAKESMNQESGDAQEASGVVTEQEETSGVVTRQEAGLPQGSRCRCVVVDAWGQTRPPTPTARLEQPVFRACVSLSKHETRPVAAPRLVYTRQHWRPG